MANEAFNKKGKRHSEDQRNDKNSLRIRYKPLLAFGGCQRKVNSRRRRAGRQPHAPQLQRQCFSWQMAVIEAAGIAAVKTPTP